MDNKQKALTGNYPIQPLKWTVLVPGVTDIDKLRALITLIDPVVAKVVVVSNPTLSSLVSATLTTALPRRCSLAIQFNDAGSADAVWLGLQHVRTDNVLVLFENTTITPDVIQACMKAHRFATVPVEHEPEVAYQENYDLVSYDFRKVLYRGAYFFKLRVLRRHLNELRYHTTDKDFLNVLPLIDRESPGVQLLRSNGTHSPNLQAV